MSSLIRRNRMQIDSPSHSSLESLVRIFGPHKIFSSLARVHLLEFPPQYPISEQQSPNVLPLQIALIFEFDPQFPSREIAPRFVITDDAAVEVEVWRVAMVEVEDSSRDLSTDKQVPNSLWHLFKSPCQRHLQEIWAIQFFSELVSKQIGPHSPVITIGRIPATVP